MSTPNYKNKPNYMTSRAVNGSKTEIDETKTSPKLRMTEVKTKLNLKLNLKLKLNLT